MTAERPASGTEIVFQWRKWDGSPHWRHECVYLGADDWGDWVGQPAGWGSERPARSFTAPGPNVTLVPPSGDFALTVNRDHPHGMRIYIDLAWDLRAVAAVAKGKKVAPTVNAMIVPGSGLVKAQAEAEGLDKIFIEAGFDWREPGCSMCLAMNDDRLAPHERCASTSNRNFEGRQGFKGRTHLVSPAMAAAAAIAGHFVDIRDWK